MHHTILVAPVTISSQPTLNFHLNILQYCVWGYDMLDKVTNGKNCRYMGDSLPEPSQVLLLVANRWLSKKLIILARIEQCMKYAHSGQAGKLQSYKLRRLVMWCFHRKRGLHWETAGTFCSGQMGSLWSQILLSWTFQEGLSWNWCLQILRCIRELQLRSVCDWEGLLELLPKVWGAQSDLESMTST